MFFSHDETPPVGMYDYGASDHPIHADTEITAVLAKLRSIDRQEVVVRARITELSRNTRTATYPFLGSVIDLSAYRGGPRPVGGRS